MAGTARVVSTPSSGNTWLEGILWGTEWSSGGSATVVSTYLAGQFGGEWLADTWGSYLYASVPFTKEVTAMTAAMAMLAAHVRGPSRYPTAVPPSFHRLPG